MAVVKLKNRRRPVPDIVDPDVNFVRAAAGLYHQKMNGIEPHVKISDLPKEEREEARSVAYGLYFLRHLLNREMARSDLDESVVSAVFHAQQVLDCLTAGGDGPMRRYTTHLGAASRGQAPNRTEQMKRSLVVGLVFALQQAGKRDGIKLSRRKATELVLGLCPFIARTRDTIEGWITRATTPAADWARDHFLTLAENAPKTALPFHLAVLAIGTTTLITLCST